MPERDIVTGTPICKGRSYVGTAWMPGGWQCDRRTKHPSGYCPQHRPRSGDLVRCPKCGGPDPFHDPACVVHPDLIQDHNEQEQR